MSKYKAATYRILPGAQVMPIIKKYYWGSLLFMLVAIYTTAKAQLPIDVRNIEAENYHFILDKTAVFTTRGRLDDTTFITSDSSGWRLIKESRYVNFGVVRKRLWLKFILKNSDTIPHSLFLMVANHIINKMELFTNEKGWLHSLGKTGANYSFKNRPYPSSIFAYPFSVERGGIKTFYLLIEPLELKLDLHFGLVLSGKNAIKNYEMQLLLIFGLFTGILVLVGLFNLFLFFVLKDRIHLLYFFYSISVIWVLLSSEALDFQFLYPNKPLWYLPSRISSIYVSIATGLFVMQEFLRQTSANSRFYKPVYVLKWVCLFFPLLELIIINNPGDPVVEKLYYPIYRIAQVATIILVLLSCFEKIKQGYRLAIFYLSAIAVFLIGLIISVLNNAGIINLLPVPPTIAETGIVVEAVIISFGILYRYNFFKKEKEQLVKKLSEQQISLGRQILETQENERRRIAEDLHDELGSSLAALKLRLQKSSLGADEMKEILKVVDKASEDTRNISHHLMPPEFERTSLYTLLSDYYARLNDESTVEFDFLTSGANNHFSKEEELVIYRIMMELTNNILKHSHAKEATIQMIGYERSLEIMTEDNGKGINKNDSEGIGLRNIQSRVNYLNGEMRIDSNSNGTTIIIQIPYKTI